jgi:hypothetical protein
MVNLIRLLVQQGTITKNNGEALLAQAQAEADKARANVVQAASNAGVPPPPEGTMRVPYVPAGVRKQIADEVRTEVMAQAKSEGWAAPNNAAPDWTRHVKISGDVRVRSQSELYSKQNSTDVLNIASLGASSSPINLTDVHNLPTLNTTEDRINRLKVRARLGVDADISPAVSASFRLATGDDNSPISTNAALAGGLTKRNVWLDRAYLELRPVAGLNLDFGRFPNPFRSTQLLFDEDLNFDGLSAQYRIDTGLPQGLSLAFRAGAFPLDNGSPNYPDTSDTKASYPSKWLFSGQFEAKYEMDNGVKLSGAVAYHDFSKVQGQLSDPCAFNGVTIKYSNANGTTAADPTECSTDGTRVMNPRKGNTLMFIRNNYAPAGDVIAADRQYLGLVQPFRILDLNASATVPINEDVKATLSGDFLVNLAYKKSNACRYGAGTDASSTFSQPGLPINNFVVGSTGNVNPCAEPDPAEMVSGNKGWLLELGVGHDHPNKWGQWWAAVGYRYLQSDAVLDSFTDSDFHLGGTNAKGFTVYGTMGLLNGVSLGARWMSANEVRGEPLSIDVLQIDLKAEF